MSRLPVDQRPETGSHVASGVVDRVRRFVADPLRRADADALAWAHRNAGRFDARTATVLVTTAVALTVQQYVFRGTGFVETVGEANRELTRLVVWVTGQYVGYVAIPLAVIRFVLREDPRDFGVGLRNAFSGAWLYGGMFAVMFPVVWYCSTTEAFLAKYPFYRLSAGEPLWPRFLVWEALYAVQFVALEFFFRGFLLHGTKHRFGSGAIFVMVVPYCMIHFGKPMPETLGAIVAGIVLGFTSLKTNSIWLGAAIHIAVAWSMDGLALLAR